MAKKVPIVQATFYNNNTKQIENCYPMTSAKGVVMSDGKTLEESFSDKADNSVVVHKSGDEEILGRKTFDDLRANGFCLSDNGDWNRWVSAFYSFLEGQGIIQFGTEEDWSVILRNIADPENENDAATKGYVDIKIGDASIPVLQYGVLINNDLPSILESKEQAIANAPIYEKILSGEVKFFAAKAGNDLFISSKIQITNGKANVTLLGLKVPSLTLHIVQMTIGQSGLSSKINLWMNLQSVLTDTDGGYGQRVAELETGKANIQHQHTVADITDFPELYYDATAFFASAYPSEKYEELLEAVKAKKTVYATIDEAGHISYVFFMSSANSDGSSSRVLLTTIFADGNYLYLNTFVLQQSGMTPLQESITGKADKATTLAGYGIADAYTKSEMNALLNRKQDTLTAGNGISIEGNVISSTVDSLITPITYAELVALRDSSSLVAGMQYRITDYACTTTQENTQSAGHPFDIIVTADSENTLNEEARAIQHEGDTYFADCDLNAWKIWYCLDNDATRFAWADIANGKGVIYRMIDEWNNDVPYDFKNIQFKRYILDANNAIATDVAKDGELNAVKSRLGEMSHRIHTSMWYYGEYVTDVYPNAEQGRKYVPFGDIFYNGGGPGVLCPINEANSNWFYTFSDTSFNDNTLTGQGNVHDNVVKGNKYALVTIDGEGRYNFEEQENICLNDIIFIGNNCDYNSFGDNCNYNSFGNNCDYNSFGNNCYSNSFGNNCDYNSFGNSCFSNSFGNYCNSNSFGNNCFSNSFGNDCYYNSFGNYCFSNSFGNSCNSNSFGNYCYSNSFGNNCNSNSFGNSCYYNSFGNSCNSNSFGNDCNSNSFGDSCYYNSFGNYCNSNSFGNSCYYNSFGNYCNSNSFGNYCYSNSFGNNCNYIKFATSSSATTKYNYYQQNHFGDGCQFIIFKGAETASSSAQVQNYNFAQGLQGTSSAYLTIDGVRSRAYETKVAKNSSGELKIYCEADLIQ